MPGTIEARYAERVRAGRIEADEAQKRVVARLDGLREELAREGMARKTSALGWLFGARKSAPPRGLYIWGDVGRGKTMLMDLFFETVAVSRKRRAHFHSFMADVHARVFEWRQKHKRGEVKGDDPLGPVAADIAAEAHLLCFDEFAVATITDAMILGRLFQALFDNGVVVVATSNVAPENLYRDGLNRALFTPFIRMIEDRMEVLRLDSRTDFRLEKLTRSEIWFSPDGPFAREKLDEMFRALTGQAHGTEQFVEVFGRRVRVPEGAQGVARFTFDDLCMQPLGSADYVAIARAWSTLLISGIPKLSGDRRNELKRFIVLIDALYDHRVKLIASAAAAPEKLYTPDPGVDGDGGAGAFGGAKTEAFEYKRTLSRLTEMQSAEYLALPHGSVSDETADTSGLVET